MLTSLVLHLQPTESVTLPQELARIAHALFLGIVSSHNAQLAEDLHNASARKPFTCSNFWGGQKTQGVVTATPQDTLRVRYTGLSVEVSAVLQAVAANPVPTCEIAGSTYQVKLATLDPAQDHLAGQTTYEDIQAPYLFARRPSDRSLTLQCVSPTAFRSSGVNFPFPVPESVFGSLAEKWNDFAPIHVPVEEIRRFARECLLVSRFKGRTRIMNGRGLEIGFVGVVRYTATHLDPYWLGLLNILADYAWYAGVGRQTTQGMGQTRRYLAPPSLS